jgi:hypothetical protein
MTDTLHRAIEVIDQLHPIEQAQLLEVLSRRVARQISAQHPHEARQSEDSWARLEAFRRDMESLGDAAPDFGAQLNADRNARQIAPEGSSDVHA